MPTTDGVNPALDTYVPLPAGVAVPTNVPPAEHVAGALACGPNTLNVIVEVALLPELDPNAAVIDAAETTVPAVPVPGAETDNVGLALATENVRWTCGAGIPVHVAALIGVDRCTCPRRRT